MNTAVEKVIQTALGEVGVVESPKGSNRTKYGLWYGVNGQPWCAIWTSWVFHHAGYPLPKIQPPCPSGAAYCPYIEHYAKKVGEWHSKPQPGDLALFHFGKKLAVHIGIVESVHKSGASFYSIEGNTGTTNQDNGGRVMRRKRWVSLCRGFYRPSVLGSSNPTPVKTGVDAYYRMLKLTYPLMQGDDVRAWQKQMNYFLYGLEVDGYFGVECERVAKDLQKKRKLEVDGIVGPNTWRESFEPD